MEGHDGHGRVLWTWKMSVVEMQDECDGDGGCVEWRWKMSELGMENEWDGDGRWAGWIDGR